MTIKITKLMVKYLCLILVFSLGLALLGCAGKGPTLSRTQSPNAPELYAQAKALEERASGEADIQNVVTAYTKAIRAGSPEAACDLAELYLSGFAPVKPGKDESAQDAADKAAFNLYLQAAKADYAPAQYKTAVMYAEARGTDRNMAEARAWLLKAGEAGYAQAQDKLGDAFLPRPLNRFEHGVVLRHGHRDPARLLATRRQDIGKTLNHVPLPPESTSCLFFSTRGC